MSVNVWHKAWAGDPEPDWTTCMDDVCVGYGYQCSNLQVKSGEWLSPLKHAVLAAHAKQFPDVTAPQCVDDINPIRVVHNPSFWFTAAPNIGVEFGTIRVYHSCVAAKLSSGVHPTEEEFHTPTDHAILRYYDVDWGNQKGWCRRCAVWRFRRDTNKSKYYTHVDDEYVSQLGSSVGLQRRDQHHTYDLTSTIEAVRAVHKGDPDWVPHRPDISSQVLYCLKAARTVSGNSVLDDPKEVDRLFYGDLDVDAWTELDKRNQPFPAKEFDGLLTHHVNKLCRWKLDDVGKWV